MTFSKGDKGQEFTLGFQEPASQRPKTPFQRLSSGFVSIMPNIPLRKSTPKQNQGGCPKTAPGPTHMLSKSRTWNRFLLPERQELISRIEIPTLSDSEQSCPYDPSKYHSFPSIEPSRCKSCGLRLPSRPALGIPNVSRPCSHCQSRSPLSYIASSFNRLRGQSKSSCATQSSLVQLIDSSALSDERPRPVTATIAAKRMGNPPRRAALPLDYVPAYITLRPPSNPHVPLAEQHKRQQRASSRTSNILRGQLNVSEGQNNYPYVRKEEVEAHLAALRAGAPSPFRRSIDEVRSSADPREPSQDYSQTVFCGHSLSPSHPQSATGIFQRVQANENLVIEEGRPSGRRPITLNLELESNQIYRRRTPQPHSQHGHHHPQNNHSQDTDSGTTYSTLTTQTPSTVGGKRLELKGGSAKPTLRGGGGDQRALDVGVSFRFKKWILTCHGSCRTGYGYGTDSDDDLPPPLAHTPERVARAYQRMHGRVPLPANISRGGTSTRYSAESTAAPSIVSSPAPTLNTAYHDSPTRSRRQSRLPSLIRSHLPSRQVNSPIIQPFSDAQRTQSQPFAHPILSLRGGAGPASPWRDADRLPPTLYWLAGGRRKPITAASWNKQKPKKRLGGLLGMALHGYKGGTEYVARREIATTIETGASMGKGDTANVKSKASSTKATAASASSSSSSSSSSAVSARGMPPPVEEPAAPAAAEQLPDSAPDAAANDAEPPAHTAVEEAPREP